jgi:hypothetical protein
LRIPEPSNGAPISESSEVFSLKGSVGFDFRLPPPSPEGVNSEPARFGDGAEFWRSREELELVYATSGLVILRVCPAEEGVCLDQVGAEGERCREPELLLLRREWLSLFRTSIKRFKAAALPGGGFLVSLLVVDVFVSSMLT